MCSLNAHSFVFAAASANSRVAARPPPGIPQPNQRPFLHSLFSNRMVLARNRRGLVFGYATAGTKITVTLRRQSSSTQVGNPARQMSIACATYT